MTALIILGSILGLIVLLLLSHISFYVKVDSGVAMFLRFWFVKFELPPKKRKIKKKQEETDELLKESQKDKNIITKMIKEKGVRETVLELWSVFKPILLKAIEVFKKIKVKRLKLRVITASDDAAKTALEYGGVCAVVYPVLAFLKSVLQFPDKAADVHIDADYDAAEPTLYLDLKLKIRVITVLRAALSVLWSILRSRFKKEFKSSLTKKGE
ncbi:MAG: hypothetical protein E7525_03540 [Ruminococcaceae bacterium]|nr:hypothetical protein [Oscillospiraceae bacterium]